MSTTDATAKAFPLFMSYQLPVDCNGFRVLVTMRGRLLMEQDGDETWIYGINPAGMCASGRNLEGALNAFTKRFRSVLFDLAEVATTYEEFETELTEVFDQKNEEYAKKWEDARQAVSSSGAELAGLPKVSVDAKPHLRLQKIVIAMPSQNPKEEVSVYHPSLVA